MDKGSHTMKKILAFLACALCATSVNAAFISLPDGSTPSAPQVEFEGNRYNGALNINRDIRVLTQFQLSALDRSTDDLNGDGFLTVAFAYFFYDAVSPVFIAWDTISDNSILWDEIEAGQATADSNDELTFDSFFKEVVSGPYDTARKAADGEADYLVLALVEGTFYIGPQYWGLDLIDPPPPVSSVSTPATLGLLSLSMFGLLLRRRKN